MNTRNNKCDHNLNGHFHSNFGIRFVVDDFEIIHHKVSDVLDVSANVETRECTGLAGQLNQKIILSTQQCSQNIWRELANVLFLLLR